WLRARSHHGDEIAKRFGAQRADRLHFAALPRLRERPRIAVRPDAPVALRVLHPRSPVLKRLLDAFPPALAAEHDDIVPADGLQLRQCEQALAVVALGR